MKKNQLKTNIEIKKDTLTGLYDRQVVIDYANQLIKEKTPFSFALIDIDNFKNINDGYGHNAGDKIICFMAKQIQKAFENKALVGRFGGDEFLLVIPEVVEYDEVWALCRQAFLYIDGVESDVLPGVVVTSTLGLSRFNQDADNIEALMEKADKALYRGKLKGRSCFIIYLSEKHDHIQLRSTGDSDVNSMQKHNQIFQQLTSPNPLSQNIQTLFKYLSTSLMMDHIALQSDNKLVFSTVYSLSREKEFKRIPNNLIVPNVSAGMSIFYQNDVKQLEKIKQDELMLQCLNQGICSCFYAEISYQKYVYGYLRCDSSSTNRIWQYDDMDLLLTAAKTIGLLLHYNQIEIDDL